MWCRNCQNRMTGSLSDRFRWMTSRWYIIVIVLVTSLIFYSNSYLIDFIFWDVDSPTQMVVNRKRIKQHTSAALTDFIRKQKCPTEYVNQRWGDRTAADGAVWRKLTQAARNHGNETDESTLPPRSPYISKYPPLDIPTHFNESFLNPCWWRGSGDLKKLRCLPYYFLAGFPKSGTTDLFYRMALHPQIRAPVRKEPHWWTRWRLGSTTRVDGTLGAKRVVSLSRYLDMFHESAKCMEKVSKLQFPGRVPFITGDGSASTFWDNRRLPISLGEEPSGLQADDIAHYLPGSKIIVILRDPTERLFSDYLYFWNREHEHSSPSREDFHERVRSAITTVTDCMKNQTVRTCVYTGNMLNKMLKEAGYEFDVAFTSVLKRAIKTLYYLQDEMDLHWIPVVRHWRLNERMYGALQGLNKAETAAKHGEEQVKIWRRSYDTPPPAVETSSEHWPGHDSKYQFVDKNLLPKAECLKDTVDRVLPFWYDQIVPEIKKGQRVVIAAHGNSLRAMVKYLDNMSDADIMALNIPTGIPLVYELDGDLQPIKHYYLASEEDVKAATDKVAAQGKAK